jgi:hypothetical protein
MSFVVTHRFGEMERDIPLDQLPSLLDQLDPRDAEHAEVAVMDESGWSVAVTQADDAYRLVWEDVEASTAAPVHMVGVGRERALEIMALVAKGRLDEVAGLEWRPGYT